MLVQFFGLGFWFTFVGLGFWFIFLGLWFWLSFLVKGLLKVTSQTLDKLNPTGEAPKPTTQLKTPALQPLFRV